MKIDIKTVVIILLIAFCGFLYFKDSLNQNDNKIETITYLKNYVKTDIFEKNNRKNRDVRVDHVNLVHNGGSEYKGNITWSDYGIDWQYFYNPRKVTKKITVLYDGVNITYNLE